MIINLYKSLKITKKNYLNWLIGIHLFCASSLVLGLYGLWLISYMMIKFNYSRSLSSFICGLFYISSGISGIIFGKIAVEYKQCKK